MSEGLMLPTSSSPTPTAPVTAQLPDVNDLLAEILIRLPPRPSSLPRASGVCKRWYRLVSDPRFLRRFHAHHRKPPLLGFFSRGEGPCSFTPTLSSPDRIPAARLSLPLSDSEHWELVDCRHGLLLLFDRERLVALVRDPITGHQRRVAFPPCFDNYTEKFVQSGAVLCAAGNDHVHVFGDCPLNLVLVRSTNNSNEPSRAFACLYQMKSGIWGNIISTAITEEIDGMRPNVLIGNALCWLLYDGSILKFDFARQSLVMIEKPADAPVTHHIPAHRQILRTQDSGLGLAMLTGGNVKIWERKASSDGVFRWVLQKTVELDKHLPPERLMEKPWIFLVGFDEDTNMIFLYTILSFFMVQLESMQFIDLPVKSYDTYYAYKNFYTPGRRIGGGDGESEMFGGGDGESEMLNM